MSIGPGLRALAVYLVVFQHSPVERCRDLLIAALITAACVAGFDETTLRARPAGQKKYVLGAFTESTRCCSWAQREIPATVADPLAREFDDCADVGPSGTERRLATPIRQVVSRRHLAGRLELLT